MEPSDLTPEQKRLLRQTRAMLSDPASRRRLGEAQEALAHYVDVQRASVSALAENMAPALHRLNGSIDTWLRGIDWDRIRDMLGTIGRAFLRLVPVNARELGVESWPTLQRIASEEQLCLSWVPDVELARQLVLQPDGGKRELLLLESRHEVLIACQNAIDEVRTTLTSTPVDPEMWPSQLADVADLIGASVRAAAAGHNEAAQALATCAADTLLTQHVARRKPHSFVKLKLKLLEEQQFAAVLLGPVLAAVDSSMRQQASWERAVVGSTTVYSRHATVHAVSTDVFGEATLLEASILATSLLKMSVSPLLPFLVHVEKAESME